MKILVLSDTHVPTRGRQLPPFVERALRESPDLIVHAGDVVSEAIIDYLLTFAPVEAVAGNMDRVPVSDRLPRQREIACQSITIGLVHGDGYSESALREAFGHVDIVIFGHTHTPHLEFFEGQWFFNPGSPVDPRGGSQPAFGWIQIEDDLSFSVVNAGRSHH